MDKDTSQINHHRSVHHENSPEDSALPHTTPLTEQELSGQEAEMDALEARLFAMANSRG